MKTLKDKGYYCKNTIPSVFVYEEEDLKQAIKDLKVERPMHYSMNEWIDKIFGVWEE